MSINKFPPKFSQNILYPAIYNLDEYDMPQSNYLLGTYFDVHWPNYGINTIPTLTYGKHSFTITIKAIDTMYNSQGYQIEDSLPNLKKGSRILFEFKDSAGNVVFSDSTPLRKYDGFTSYVWIKQDPVRTHQDIQEGYGTLTIVAKVQNNDPNWRNKYNIRTTQDIYISLHNADNVNYMNESPILFQQSTSSLGSGSGLEIYEHQAANAFIDPDIVLSHVNISSSRLRTYSGEVDFIKTYIQVEGSTGADDNPWQFLADHQLKPGGIPSISSSYEDDIYKLYGHGINPLSDHWNEVISSDIIEVKDGIYHKVKFKLEFYNPDQQIAKSTSSGSESDFVLIYPERPNDWLEFTGSMQTYASMGGSGAGPGWYIDTVRGQISFNPKFNSSIHPQNTSGYQKFDDDGNIVEFGDDGSGRNT